eukprot:15060721-Alexandrium_andersonii.AAC.1
MSASLVGSEMCIRDSAITVLALRCTRAKRFHPSALSLRGRPKGAAMRGCLLYTSDAADDM